MKINGNAIRPGMIIEHKEQLWRAIKAQATQPGKGGAYNQVELRNLRDGSKLNERFRAAQDVERTRLDEHPHQFLYREGDELTFMNTESYDQVSLDASFVGNTAKVHACRAFCARIRIDTPQQRIYAYVCICICMHMRT